MVNAERLGRGGRRGRARKRREVEEPLTMCRICWKNVAYQEDVPVGLLLSLRDGG